MLYKKTTKSFQSHLRRMMSVLLITCLLFGLSPLQVAHAAAYLDDFSSAPFSGVVPSFTTGTTSEGLSYTCTNCDFGYSSGWIDFNTITAGSESSFTIISRSGGSFVFSSIDLDTAIPLTLSGSLAGSPVFSRSVSAGTNGTVTPVGGDQIVDTITVSSSSAYEMMDFFDNVSVSFGPSLNSFTRQTPTTTPTNTDSLTFRATFSEGVQDVSTEDFTVNGTTTATVTGVTPQSTSVYDITVSGGNLASFNGVVGIDLDSGHNITSLADSSPVPNGEPSIDETYTLDNTGPTVTINQAGGQADPTTSGPINFTVVFNESVSNFATGDVTLGGTAGATTATVTGSGTTYNVAVSGMNVDGTVIASIGAGVATDPLGNPNSASTSTDNQVTFDGNPEIDIQRPASTSIADGGTDALGNQSISSTVSLTYTVDNSAGTDALTVSNVTASNESNVSNFSLDTTIPLSIPAGSTSSFDISFDIDVNGAFSFDMDITNTDSDEGTYDITVSGTGTGGAPEIDIQQPAGAVNSIADGGTDALGNQAVGTVNRTYTVDNTAGTDQLSISGVTTSNATNVSGFTLNTATPINIPAGSSGTFNISFDVDINGAFSFDMDIANNDSDENPYDITVSGTGTGGTPEIDIQRPASTSIVDGGTDNTGSNPVGTINLTYTIDNSSGTDSLSVTNITAGNLVNVNGFTLNTGLPINIAAGNTDTFDISFNVPATGAFSLDMDVTNNDPDEGNYDIAVTGTGYIEPEIEISYEGTTIPDNDITPSTAEGTDFGYDLFSYAAYSPQHTFTITNSGAGTLLLTDSPRVSVTGTDFSLISDAPISIAPGDSATFTVQFAASAVAVRNGSISIDNNDSSENPYNFAITGTGYSGPLMIVQGGSPQQDIEDGDTTPTTADDTEFGVVPVSGGTASHTFEIENFGSGSLSLPGSPIVQITGANAVDFTVTLQPNSIIAGGSNVIFRIEFNPSAPGNRTATVTIQNNDPNSNPYTFNIQGQGDEFEVMSGGNTNPTDGETLNGAPSSLLVQFTREALADGSADSANTINNYLLVEAGINASFDTLSCVGGVVSDDTQLNISGVTYNSLANTATLTVNSADFSTNGQYRLFICGTTSIYDTFGNELNGGTSDTIISFSIAAASNTNASTALALPATGFPIGENIALPVQSVEKQYKKAGMTLEIPVLGVELPITGVPLVDNEWDVSWLTNEAGYLYGTAYPTWKGNTVITGHVWDAYNQPGPFYQLKDLHFGDLIKIQSGNSTYIYEVHDTRLHKANSIHSVILHEELDWLTLVTCEDYQENNQTYGYRRVVRAVLIETITQ